MNSVKFKLAEPIVYGSETISELEVRKPKAKDLRKFPSNSKTLGEMLDFAGGLCGQPPSVIDELSIEDALKLFEVIMNFLPDGLKTGPKV